MGSRGETKSLNLYQLNEKPPLSVTVTAALQWFFITISSSLVIPLVIGEMYGLAPQEVGQFVQQTFFFIGLASLLQVLFGHRLPITEGPAGMWWGIFVIMANLGVVAGQAPKEVGQTLEMGLILTGIMLIVLSATGFIEKVQKVFTPLVSGGYLVLLAISLSGSFMKGMLGIDYYTKGSGVQPELAAVSIGIVLLTFAMIASRFKYVRSFAILIGMIIGWIIYIMMDWTKPLQETHSAFSLPQLFFWGPPVFQLGTVLTSLITGFILITNLIASIVVVSQVVGAVPEKKEYKQGGILTGVAHILSGAGGIVGLVPLSISAGVIQVSRIASRLPFILSAVFLMLLGVLPPVSRILAGLPSPIGYAVMFVSFTQLLGFGLRDFGRVVFDERNIFIVGFGLLGGIGLMFVPAQALQGLPPIFGYIFGNGLVVGVLLIIFMEQVVFRKKPAQ
ncbi:purine/pyrimidine permease [Aneurinibacillus sp. BA2021]|nr:purine/pyrimidine permease [Aneurinibacillus sp. BA2021]